MYNKGMETNNSRRLKMMAVHASLIDEFLRDGYEVGGDYKITVQSPIPSDAKLVRVWYDISIDTVYFVYEHESFDLVELGSMVPVADHAIFTQTMHEVKNVDENKKVPDYVNRRDCNGLQNWFQE